MTRVSASYYLERELLLKALDQITPKDVLVLDRGYPAWWLFAAMQVRHVQFCARIEGCGWAVVEGFLRSDRMEHMLCQRLKSHDRKKLKAHGLPVPETLKLRLVKVRLPNGQFQVLATSLMDTQRFPTWAFAELYRRRWGIEEGFKLVKQRQHLEGFSGELPESIEQEIQAKILMHNITQAVCHQAQRRVPTDKQGAWQINRAHAIKSTGRALILCLNGVRNALRLYLESLTSVLSKTLERIRPHRSFPRPHSIGGAQRPRKSYR